MDKIVTLMRRTTAKMVSAVIVAAALSFSAIPATSAQTQSSLGHQLSLYLGDGLCLPSVSAGIESFGNGIGTIIAAPIVAVIGGDADDISVPSIGVKSKGLYGAGYRFYLKNNRVGFGLDFAAAGVEKSTKSGDQGSDGTPNVTISTANVFYLSAGTTCYYKKSGWFRLYGGLDLGMVWQSSGAALSEVITIYDKNYGFVTNLTPIAIQLGGDRFAGFAEFNLGYKGWATVGLKINM